MLVYETKMHYTLTNCYGKTATASTSLSQAVCSALPCAVVFASNTQEYESQLDPVDISSP